MTVDVCPHCRKKGCEGSLYKIRAHAYWGGGVSGVGGQRKTLREIFSYMDMLDGKAQAMLTFQAIMAAILLFIIDKIISSEYFFIWKGVGVGLAVFAIIHIFASIYFLISITSARWGFLDKSSVIGSFIGFEKELNSACCVAFERYKKLRAAYILCRLSFYSSLLSTIIYFIGAI